MRRYRKQEAAIDCELAACRHPEVTFWRSPVGARRSRCGQWRSRGADGRPACVAHTPSPVAHFGLLGDVPFGVGGVWGGARAQLECFSFFLFQGSVPKGAIPVMYTRRALISRFCKIRIKRAF